MANQFWLHDCACDMLSKKELPLDLRNFLDDAEMYANYMGGSIQSRQVVAIALAAYTRVRTLEKNVEKLDWNGLIKKQDDS